jgi:chemotaxis protein MotB
VLNKKSEEALMRDDTTTTTLSDDAAGSGRQLIPKIAPDAAPAPVQARPQPPLIQGQQPAQQ